MGPKRSFLSKLAIGAVVFGLVVVSSILISGQTLEDKKPSGVPEDWTHHHVVFSDPGTFADAVKNGKLAEWNKITSNPRYQIQQLKRNLLQRQLQAAPDFASRSMLVNHAAATASVFQDKLKRPVTPETKKDWSMNMGYPGAAAATITGTVSASATGGQTLVIANPNTSTSITLTATPSTASASGVFSGRAGTGSALIITNGSKTLTLNESSNTNGTCSGGSPWSVSFARGNSGTSSSWASGIATVLASATTCSTDIGVTATANSPSNGDLTITANSTGTGGDSITVQWTGTSNFTPAWTTATDLTGGVAASNSGTYFEYDSTPATEAGYIAAAIAANGSTVGVTATQGTGSSNDEVIVTATSDGTAGNNITITNGLTGFAISSPLAGGANGTPATMQAGQFPAKYSFSTTSTPSCTDYVVYGTGVPGNSGQASIIAYTNLYATTCGSTTPTINWAYNTGGTAALSPVLSIDGKQVAYIQTVGTTASLVLLKPLTTSGGTATSPATISSVANSAYHNCTTPCYTTLSLGANDTNSPPFYDYINDIMYVGDDSGSVHQFTTVFGGTPTAAWTTKVTGTETATVLTGPVLDPNSGLIFVSDSTGYLHSLTASGGSEETADQNDCGSAGFTDSPLVDSTIGTSYVYVFISYGCDTGNHSYLNVYDAANTISGTYGTALEIGAGSTAQKVYAGAFDNQHTTATNGNLYVCMGDTTTGTEPTLFQIAIAGGTGAPSFTLHTYNSVSSAAATCSPVTEFYNSSDWVFLSVTGSGESVTGCTTGACVYNFAVPTGATHTGSPTAGIPVTGGSSGIVIDNNGSATGESQIYYSTLGAQSCTGTTVTGAGTGGCAVQASQSALH